MKYNVLGQELPDPTPFAIPTGLRRPPTLQEQIKAMVRGELSRQAAENDQETFEEADDFSDDDENDQLLASPHEIKEMQDEIPTGLYSELKPKTPQKAKAAPQTDPTSIPPSKPPKGPKKAPPAPLEDENEDPNT